MVSWITCCFRGGAENGNAASPRVPATQHGGAIILQEILCEGEIANGQTASGELAAPFHLPPLPHQASQPCWDAVALEATPHAVTVLALGGACPGAVLYQNAFSRSYFGNRCAADPAAVGAAGGSASVLPAAAGALLTHHDTPTEASGTSPAPAGGEESEDGSDPSVLPPVLFDLFSLCPEKLHALARELTLDPTGAQGVGGGGKCWKSVIRVPMSCEVASPLAEAASAARPAVAGMPATRQQPVLSLQPWASGGGDPASQQQAADGTSQRPSPSSNVFSTNVALRQAPSFPLLTPSRQAQGVAGSKAAAQTVAGAAPVPGPNSSAATATTGAPSTPSRHSAPLGHVPFSNSSGHLLALPPTQHHTQGSIGGTLCPPDVRYHQQQKQQLQQHRFSLQLPAQMAQPSDHPPVQLLPAAGSRHTGSSSGTPYRYHSQQGYSSQHLSGTGVAIAHMSGDLTGGSMAGTGGHVALNSACASAMSNALATSTIALAIEQQPGLASAIAHSLPMGVRTGVHQTRAVTSASGMLSSGFSGPIAAASLELSQPLLLVGQPWDEQAPAGIARARLLLPATGSGDEIGNPAVTGEHISGSGREAFAGGRTGSAGAVGKVRAPQLSTDRAGPVATPRGSLIGIPELGSFQLEERSGADGGRPAGGGMEVGELVRHGTAPDEDRFHKWLKFMMNGPLPDKSRGQFTRQLHQIRHRALQKPQQPQQQAVSQQVSEQFDLWPSGSGGASEMLSSGPQPQARPPSWQGRDATGSTAFQLAAPVVPHRSATGSRGEAPSWDGAVHAGSRVSSRTASAVSSQWGDLSTHSFTAQQTPAAAPPAAYSGSPSCPLPRMPALQQTTAATTAAQPSTAADLMVESSRQLFDRGPDEHLQHQQGQRQARHDGHDGVVLASCSAIGEVRAAAGSGSGSGYDYGHGYGNSGRGVTGGNGGAGAGRGRRGGSVGGGRVSGSDVALVRQALAPRMAAVRGRRGSSLAASASQVAVSGTVGSDMHDGAVSSSITGELSNLTSECAVPESELSMRSSSKFSQLRLPLRGGRTGGGNASNGSRSSHGGSWDAYSSTHLADLNAHNSGEPSRTRRVSDAAVCGSGWRPFVEMVPEAEATVSIPADQVDGPCEARGSAGGVPPLLVHEPSARQQSRGGSSSINLSVGGSQTAAPIAMFAAAARGGVDDAAARSPSFVPASQVAPAAGPPALEQEALPGQAEALTAAAKATPPTADATSAAGLTTPAMWEAVAAAAAAAVAGAAPDTQMRLERVHLQSLLSAPVPGAGPKSSSSGGICSAQGEPSLAVPRFTRADEALLTAALRSAGGRSAGASSVTGYSEASRPDVAGAADSPRVTRLRVAGGSVGGRLEMMDRTSNGSGTGSGATGAGCPSSIFCATLNQFPSGAVGAAGMSTSGAIGTSISGSGPQRNRLLASTMTTLDLSVPQALPAGAKPAAQVRLRALRLRGGSGTGSASGESSQPGTPGLMSPLPMDSRRQPPAGAFPGDLEPPGLASEPEAALHAPSGTIGGAVSSPDRHAKASGFLGGILEQQGARAGSQLLLDGVTAASNTASVASGALNVGANELLVPVSFDVIAQQSSRLQQQVIAGTSPAASHLAVFRAASGADPSGGFVSGPPMQGPVSAAISAANSGLGGGGGGGSGATYHRIMATVQQEPYTGSQVLVLMQTDVSAKVAAESHAILVAETQHRLLEQIYPQHVLAALMEQLVAQQAQVTQALQDAREAAVAAEATAVRAAAAAERVAATAWFQPGLGYRQAQQAPLFLSGQQPYASGGFANSGTLDALEAHYGGLNVARTASERATSRASRTEVGAVPSTGKDAARVAADAAEAAAAKAEAAAAALRRLERRAGQTVHNPPAFTGHGDLARFHPQVSVLFADIKGFTALCKDIDPEAVMRMLNDLFSRFDNLLDRYGLRKMDTIGDGYVAAGGLAHAESGTFGPGGDANAGIAADGTRADVTHAAHAAGHGNTARAAEDVALPSCPSFTTQLSPRQAARAVFKFAQAMLRAADQVPLPTTGYPVQIRIGIATGPVVSGVVGATKPKYSLFGDTVHAASRLESAGEAGTIHVSSATYELLTGDISPGPHQQAHMPGQQLLLPMDGGQWSRTAAGVQLRGHGPAEATFMWTPGA